jgi:hypothetical protein
MARTSHARRPAPAAPQLPQAPCDQPPAGVQLLPVSAEPQLLEADRVGGKSCIIPTLHDLPNYLPNLRPISLAQASVFDLIKRENDYDATTSACSNKLGA